MSLDRRISALEQRFYTFESRINRLEQFASSRLSVPQGSNRDPEVTLLSSEVQSLKLKLATIECGLAKLDERTLTAAARKSSARVVDPCRENPDQPLEPRRGP